MLSLSSQLRLKNLLLAVAKHEQEIESIRLQLAQSEGFEPYAAYRIMDSINKKSIYKDDIVFFCMEQSHLAQPDNAEAESFIEAIDLENKGYLDIHK